MSFWSGKRVFLTGHTGFKGGWLSLWLSELGARVSGYSLPPPTEPSLFVEAAIERRLACSTIGDVRDQEALAAAVVAARPEIVVHMAAQALVLPSYADPVGTFATNVMGTVHLLEAVRRAGNARAVLIITSDKCYDNRETVHAFRESAPMGGTDPYSASKGAAELVTAAYRRAFFAPDGTTLIASARAGNVVGGGDWAADRLVPDIVRALEAGREPVIRNPESTRPWQHALDPLSGYLTVCERLYAGDRGVAEAWNFGPDEDDTLPVRKVADRLCALWGKGATWRHEKSSQPHEARSLRLDASKARRALGWVPHWTIDQALGAVVDWHRARARGEDLTSFSLSQIARHGAAT